MASLAIVPFTDKHMEGAAALLGERLARQRAAEPLLVVDDPRKALERLSRDPEVSGNVAVRGDVVEAFVLARLEEHPLYGRNAWIRAAGHATRRAELLRDVYAVAADGWFRAGHRRHYVNVPALTDELDPWHRLGFHHMHVDTAVRETETVPVETNGFSIRDGRPEDLDDAVRIDLLIFEHQQATPSFGLVDIEADMEERRADWAEELADERFHYFVAERDGRIVGHTGLGMVEPDFGLPADALDLSSTAVDPSERGTGVGLALTLHAINWAAEHGYPVIFTAWRVTNLLASRFWPARGFRPVYQRLHRAVGLG